jgi:pyruvate/2-oxoglutarate dehydrogenase complex dihydrolipoamide dehydrogenase (E3) component
MTPDPTFDPRLLAHVRPSDWRNPDPAPRYDLVVLGGGTAGLVCAAGAAGLGARVALVERGLLGGECLNTGCVPSKALLHQARSSSATDFASVMARVRDARVALAPKDAATRMQSLGVDVFFGAATFAGPRAITVGGREVRFRRAVIATGSRPTVPQIPGLQDRPFLTNETVFELTTQPRDLVILGAGPVGCELAQAFARLGTRVSLIERAPQVLPRDDPDAARIIARALADDGVDVRTGVNLTHVPEAEAVLVAAGRTPNIEELDLERAGVVFDARGIRVDDRLRTTNPRIFAAGDVCGSWQFTHAADAMARIVVQNTLFFGRKKLSDVTIPWCTFTSPELAHVGVTMQEAVRYHASSVTVPLTEVDRAVIDDATNGFVRVHHERGRIVGATIVAPHAGELIALVAVAMAGEGTLAELSAAVFPYPTIALALKRAGDAYRREKLTPPVRRLLRYYFRRM